MNRPIACIVCFFIFFTECLHADEKEIILSQRVFKNYDERKHESTIREIIQYPLNFLDGFKIQLTNCYPKLTHVNHQIDFINDILRTNFRDWRSEDICTLDFVLLKNVSKHFKADFAVDLSSGALETSDFAFRNTFHFSTRFRQRYDVLMLWSNLYFYPFTCDYGEYKPNRLIDVFIGGGMGYTFLREETSIKLRQRRFYNRIKSNYNDKDIGYKLLAGFDVNLSKLSKRIDHWGITITVFKIWNRMKGHANVHLTEDLKIVAPIKIDVGYKERMDVDLTGMCYSIALCYKF